MRQRGGGCQQCTSVDLSFGLGDSAHDAVQHAEVLGNKKINIKKKPRRRVRLCTQKSKR